MRSILRSFLLFAPVTAVFAADAKDTRDKSALSMLPDGSELFDVVVPRYNEKRQLIGVMRAETLRLIDQQQAEAESCVIEFNDTEKNRNGRIDLKRILYNQNTGIVRAGEAVKIRSDQLHADGVGLVYDVNEGEGFLHGPARTWIPSSRETAMRDSKPSTAVLLVAPGVFTIATTVEPKDSDTAETFVAGAKATREELAQALADSKEANQKVENFLENTEAVDAKDFRGKVPAAKPLEIEPKPNDLVIQCDGGMYFDPEEGVFVYLKNVRVKDPRFKLSGANELKIYLEEKKEGDGNGKDDFGEIARVTASGALLFEQEPDGKREPIRASGAFFSYQIESDKVVLSGGFPWVVQGGVALRAREANLSLRIEPKARKFQTEGAWDTIVPVEEMQKKDR